MGHDFTVLGSRQDHLAFQPRPQETAERRNLSKHVTLEEATMKKT